MPRQAAKKKLPYEYKAPKVKKILEIPEPIIQPPISLKKSRPYMRIAIFVVIMAFSASALILASSMDFSIGNNFIFPSLLGGDNSTPGPVLNAISEASPDNKLISIDGFLSGSVIIKNNGTLDLGPGDFSVFIDGIKQSCRSWTKPLSHGEIRACNFESGPCRSGQNLAIVAPGNTVAVKCP